jgi:cell division protein FtsB
MTGAPVNPAYQPRGRRWMVWHLLLSLVIFAAGAATGAYGYMAYHEKQSEDRIKHPELAASHFADRWA